MTSIKSGAIIKPIKQIGKLNLIVFLAGTLGGREFIMKVYEKATDLIGSTPLLKLTNYIKAEA